MKRFLNKIRENKTNKCWEWIGSISSSGYGNFFFNSKNERAHRVSYIMYKGSIAEGLLVCHKCDNKKCVNPKHLFLGTNRDNVIDSYKKGNRKKIEKSLNNITVKYIKSLLRENYSVKEILRLVNTSKSTIYLIKINKY